MKQFFPFFAAVLLLAGCAVKETPLLKIAVISDSQAVAERNHWGMVNTDKALKFLSSFEPDALIIAGDLADRTDPKIYDIYMDVFRENFPDTPPVQVACAGNHEFWSRPPISNEIIWNDFADGLKISRDNPSRQTVGGYDFITFTEENSKKYHTEYSDKMIGKLKKVLDQAVARDNKKPIFLVTHYPPKNTVARSMRGRVKLRNLLNNYPQVISLSGHTHYPIDSEKAIWQGEFTALTTSTLSYGCIGGKYRNVTNGSILPYAREVQQAMMMNIFSDRVEIRRYHIGDNNREIKPDKVWKVAIPYDPAKALYTDDRAKHTLPPQFPENAQMSLRHDFGFAYLLFTPARHDDLVFSYFMRALVKNDDGQWETVKEAEYISDFYRYQRHQTTEFSIKIPEKTLVPGKLMRFEVYAEETFGKRSKPLAIEFQTPNHWNFTKQTKQLYPQE
ncbi:MAG: metallophosphoesterase [Lentisphaeria bacterium]|nr:metallophosphoesterase [Lentisphaeria bacterium]